MTRVFLSYSTADLSDANRLDGALNDRIEVWLDRTQVGAGSALTPTIEAAIAERDALVVLLTPRSVRSEWVQREVAHAHALGRHIIPVTHELDIKDVPMPLKGLVGDRSAVELEPLEVARHRILSALKLDPLGDVKELVLTFSDAALVERQEGEAKITRVEAQVTWGERSGRFRSPLGLLEAEEIRWYLEQYYIWPADEFENRARDIEQKLPKWGRALMDAVITALDAAETFSVWLDDTQKPYRRALALHIDPPDPDHAQPEQFQGVAALLALPWELLRDREGWLFHAHDISVRRYLPGGRTVPQAKAPIRVLVVVARPEKAGLIDPRASATALLDAVEPLGTAVQVDFLRPPTVPALVMALKTGAYHVLHFDGHGVYDPHTGLGCLCFEHEDPEERARGTTRILPGVDLREMLGNVPLPLAFLEACQSAQEGESGNAVAAALLAAGAGGVIAMSHRVLVETARRFTRTLYAKLCDGLTVGGAVSQARTALYLDRNRGRQGQGLKLSLHDWFVPVLLQRGPDAALISGGTRHHRPDPRTQAQRAAAVQSLPTLKHGFVGRSTEHLALERAFEADEHTRIGLILGMGGQGKTTLAAEMGRWFYRTGRFPGGVAFVSMEQLSDLTGVLATLGRAVIPDFALQSVEQGMEALRKYIQAKPTLLIFDNFESVLPSSAQPGVDSWVRRHPAGTQPINPDEALAEDPLHEPEFLADLLNLAHDLAHTGDSRVIITSREAIDDPRFHNNRTTRLLPLEGLTRREAIELVGETCRLVGIKAEAAKDEDLEALVDAVSCHPRTLVLLPPLLKDRGVAGVTENLHELMAELERKHPGQREKSLYASLKLSLDRLPKDIRSKLAPLGLLRGGVSTPVLAAVLGLEEKGLTSLVETLAARALLTPEGLYLRFHPALAPFLMAELRAEQPAEVELLWHHVVEAYDELMGLLYQMWNGPQHHQATRLATRELPNLLQALAHLGRTEATTDLDRAMKFATYLEGLLQGTAYRHALAEVAVVRDGLATRGGAAGRWSEAQYLSDRAAINRLLEAGRLEEALLASEALVRNIDAAGLASWSGADHAHATAHFLRGRVLQLAGEPEAALVELMESRRSFLGLPGNKGAHMASSSLRETGDCLQALGRLDEAAESYQQAIEEHRAGGYDRDVAVAQGQLATVRLFQGSYAEALQGFRAARTIFVLLDEPVMVATAWHQEGVAQQQAGQPAAAEAAYQEALAINQTLNNLSAAAETMNQLAIVADQAGRLEEAVAWDRRALEIFCAVGHRRHEAASRTNLAERLHRLGQLVEAEAEIRQAITLQEFLGLGNQPWISWDIMHDIAHDRGDHPATIHAREKAMEWYRRYRAQGGYPKTSAAQFFAATARNLATDGEAPDALSAEFVLRLVNPRSPVWLRPLFLALIAVLKGDANTARVVLPDLNYMDAVELERLLAGTWP